jgi:hypothetical protein
MHKINSINKFSTDPIPNFISMYQMVSKTEDGTMSLTYARCAVRSKQPVVRTDALDITAELVQCQTAVVTATCLV